MTDTAGIDLQQHEAAELITTTEQQDFARLDDVVRRGLATFVEVGQALAEISSRKLYREHHATFAAYLQHEHGLSRSRGYQLIEAAGVAADLSTIVDKPPVNEAQCRELLSYADADRQEVWQQVVEQSETTGKPITARMIREAGEPYREPAAAGAAGVSLPPATQSRGIGVQRANEAVACLKRIPQSDGLRDRAYEIVADYIEHNHRDDIGDQSTDTDAGKPGFHLISEKTVAMRAVRSAFAHWPSGFRDEARETLLNLAGEDLQTW